MKKIAILASGSGSNAENIANFFKNDPQVEVSFILTNNSNAFVLERAKKLGIQSFVFNRSDFYESAKIVDKLSNSGIDLIVLAGFLWLVPDDLIKAFPNRIINIHPALLPKFGGKGMYGDRVHQAVVDSGEVESGITIHFVNEKYDEGTTIFQARCEVTTTDSSKDIAEKVHALEYQYFPSVIAQIVEDL